MAESLHSRVSQIIVGRQREMQDALTVSVEQANKLRELDDLVQSKKVEERMAQIRSGKT